MRFTLPNLVYPYDALEPYIDKETMKIHHQKHHQAYVDKLNALIDKDASLANFSAEDLLAKLDKINPEIKSGAINFAGGHVNHSFFWKIMSPVKTEPGKLTQKVIDDNWGSLALFSEEFSKKAMGVFGSGWAWLVTSNNQFEIITTPNQDSPLSISQKPILGIDVWEHAYYLRYQNKKDEYIKAWWNIVNWKEVEVNLEKELEE